jgi:site-specific recombinase XerD
MATIRHIGKSWYIDFRVKGKRVRQRIGRSKQAAENYLKKVDYDLSLGGENLIPREYPVEEFIQEYLNYAKANKSATSYQRDRTTVNNLKPFLQEKGIETISEITSKLLDEFKVHRLRQVGGSTVNRDFNTIRAMLNTAIKWDRIRENPANRVARARSQEIIPRFLEDKQVEKILKEAKELFHKSAGEAYLYPFLATAYYAGLRKAELIKLEWPDIKDGVLYVRNKGKQTTKSRKDRAIPVHQKLQAIMDQVPKDSNWCFTKGGKKLTSMILRKC